MKKKIALGVTTVLAIIIVWFFFFSSNIVDYYPQSAVADKITFIPGWLHSPEFYGFQGLNIWTEKVNPQEKIQTDYVVGYSLGANFALENWENNRDKKIILVDPLVPQRNFGAWMWRWLKFALAGGSNSDKNVSLTKNFMTGMEGFVHLTAFDPEKILREIPKENITIICTTKDYYFCDSEARQVIKNDSIKLILIDGVGHEWNGKISDTIKEIVNQ